MTVAKLVTEITADSSKFTAALKSAEGSANSFNSAMKAGGVAAIAIFTALAASAALVGKEIFQAADKVSELYDNTRKIGVSVAAFQELSVAAHEAGVSTEGLQNLLGQMNKRLGDAALNGGKTAEALSALGVTFKDLQNLTTDQKFELIASKLRQVKNLQLETAVGSEIFGKSFRDAVGLVNSNLDESRSKVQEFGITLSESQAAGLDKLSETKDFIGTIWEGFKNNVAAEVAPAFQDLLDKIQAGIKGMGGLKDAAKSTADAIISVMDAMVSSVNFAVSAIKDAAANLRTFKGVFDDFKLGTLEKATSSGSKNSAASSAGQSFGVGANSIGASNAATSGALSQSAQKAAEALDISAQVLFKYTSTTSAVDAAMKTFKQGLETVASTLDKFKAIRDAFAAPGQSQAKSIIEQATKDTAKPLADNAFFQSMFTNALREIQNGQTGGLEQAISQLQGVIDNYKFTNFDTSGMVQALNELKSFAANPKAPQQTVQVKIAVSPTEQFNTDIVTSTTFKAGVDQQLDSKLAQMARGQTP